MMFFWQYKKAFLKKMDSLSYLDKKFIPYSVLKYWRQEPDASGKLVPINDFRVIYGDVVTLKDGAVDYFISLDLYQIVLLSVVSPSNQKDVIDAMYKSQTSTQNDIQVTYQGNPPKTPILIKKRITLSLKGFLAIDDQTLTQYLQSLLPNIDE
jgi:hypothetical protein